MITLKKGTNEHYLKAQRRESYDNNPAYKKRCKMCGAKVVFRYKEIVNSRSIVEQDYVLCTGCGQKIYVDAINDDMSYWRWRLFYEKKCSE